MIVELAPKCSLEHVEEVTRLLTDHSFNVTKVDTQRTSYLVALGGDAIDLRVVGHHVAVADVFRVTDGYKLVSKKWKAAPTSVAISETVSIADGGCEIIAGPCSLENEEQIASIATHLAEQGVRVMRGGAFKPRTSPYTFRGLGIEGLKLFYRIAREQGLVVVSEVMEISQIPEMYDYIDIYQVGARHSQNFSLLDELGKVDKPVLVKRGVSGTIEELLQSAEYIFSRGNEKLLLCERGIRTYEKASRNTLDVNAVPILKEKSHLPVIVDPSHGIGIRRFVAPIALASVMAGADGVMYEVHEHPDKALSDAQQTLDFRESARLVTQIRQLKELRDTF